MADFHAIVWIDHHQARVFHFTADASDRIVVHPARANLHIHHKANSIDSGHAPEDQHFFHQVIQAIQDAGEVLLTGPANAKTELLKHIERHDSALRQRIVAVETMDHPTDGELIAHARKFFRTFDRLGLPPLSV